MTIPRTGSGVEPFASPLASRAEAPCPNARRRKTAAAERTIMLPPLAMLAACGGGGTASAPAPPAQTFSGVPAQAPTIVTRPDAITAIAHASVTGNVLSNDTASGTLAPLAVASVDLLFAYDNFVGRPLVGDLGTLVLNADGSFSYAVADNAAVDALGAGQTARIDFGYFPAAGAFVRATSETLTVIVSGVNDPPTAVADTAMVAENQAASFAVVGNDTDPDSGDVLALVALGAVATTSANGAADGSDARGAFTIVDGEIRFEPSARFDALGVGETATVMVAYTVRDAAGLTSSSSLTLTVAGEAEAGAGSADDRATVGTVAERAILLPVWLSDSADAVKLTEGMLPEDVGSPYEQLGPLATV